MTVPNDRKRQENTQDDADDQAKSLTIHCPTINFATFIFSLNSSAHWFSWE
jgi:hypothetical protein